ncbi:MAG: hypothetical protein IJ489_03945 [Clostridia bacterium]|nr:hypothetical protein [Clostridia bacterium]
MVKNELKGKAFLNCLLKYETEINEKTAELAYWKEQSALQGNETLAEDIRMREMELQNLIASMTEKKLTATRLIDSMSDPVGRAVLRRRYILCDTWAKIASACGRMSERNAHYIHDQALLDFEKIFCGG